MWKHFFELAVIESDSSSSAHCHDTIKEILTEEGAEGLLEYYFVSVKFGNIEAVRRCLDCNVDPNSTQDNGCTALHEAAELGDIEMGRLLLSRKGIKVNIMSLNGIAPIHSACHNGKGRFVLLLLEHGANPNIRSAMDRTPLHLATMDKQDFESVVNLLQYKADPNVLDIFCESPLSNCILRQPNFRLATFLIHNHDAKVNVHCEGEISTFLGLCQSCRSENNLKFLSMVLEKIKDTNETETRTKKNALHFAAAVGYLPSVNILLIAGVSTKHKDIWNRTPRDVALQHNNTNVADILEIYDFFGYFP